MDNQNKPADQIVTETEEKAAEAALEQTEAEDDGYVPVAIVDYDEYEDAVESAATASAQVRARLAAKEGITERPRYERGDMTFKEKVDNFFYHHKTGLIIAAVTILMFGIIIWQSRPAEIDYYVALYAEDTNFKHSSMEKLYEVLTACGEDVDGNGEVAVTVPDHNFFSQEPYMGAVGVLTFDQDAKGLRQCSLMLIDKVHYDSVVENYGEEIFESRNGLPRWIPIKGTSFGEAIHYADDDPEYDELGLSLMVYPEGLDLSKRKMEKAINYYTTSAELLDSILEAYPDLASNAQQVSE
ncbi:MAG: hypothetical protein E7559_05890 [Ruminococcaceae bacterium]|nr:hypothetical protein [Oscillospiraceae bacterium]